MDLSLTLPPGRRTAFGSRSFCGSFLVADAVVHYQHARGQVLVLECSLPVPDRTIISDFREDYAF